MQDELLPPRVVRQARGRTRRGRLAGRVDDARRLPVDHGSVVSRQHEKPISIPPASKASPTCRTRSPIFRWTTPRTEPGIPVGFWRSVGNSQNGFFSECFVDELAAAGKKDPYEFRRKLLDKAPRHLGVLELAAQKAGWDKPLPAGRYRGIAVLFAFESYAAQVVEISVNRSAKTVMVHRVVCAVDMGRVVNPLSVAMLSSEARSML